MELIKQQDEYDCGVANCVMLVNHYTNLKITIEEFKLTHKYNREEYSLDDIKNTLVKYQIDVDFYQIENVQRIIESDSFPLLLVIKNNKGFNHYVIVNNYNDGYFEIYDPNYSFKRQLNIRQLEEISLNYVGFVKKNNKSYELKETNSFNRKYWLRFISLFKEEWKIFIVINLISMLNLFCFFFGNMFIKVILTEYSYLTFNRAILIVLMFLGIITLWFLFGLVQRLINQYSNQKIIYKHFINFDNKYDLWRANKSFNEGQQIEEVNNYLTVLKQQLYLINNFIGFSLFTSVIIYLTAHISLVLLVGTLLLILCLLLLKIWQVKRTRLSNQQTKMHSRSVNYFNDNLVKNFRSINQKISLEAYLKLNKEFLKEPIVKDPSLVMYCEKAIMFAYYLLMIFTMHDSGIDVSLFLVVTNITFVFSSQLERILNSFSVSFLENKKLKIINNLKRKAEAKKLTKEINLTNKNVAVKTNVVRVKNLEDVLINDFKLSDYEQSNVLFDCSLSLVLNEVVSNNLFNYGQSQNIDNFSKFNLNKYLEDLNISLSSKTYLLNEEQLEFIKVSSCLFTNRKIILIKKNKYKWFLHLERDIKKHLKDKVVIIYE